MKNRIAKLIDVKSIVTILLTILFMVLAIQGKIEPEKVVTIYMIIIAFYFGTQYEKKSKIKGGKDYVSNDNDSFTNEP